MPVNVTISDELIPVLEQIASKLALPAELSVEERCEFAIDALVNSYDSSMDDSGGMEDRSLVTAEELQDAIATVTSPNISTEFTPPGEQQAEPSEAELTWDEVVSLAGSNKFVVAAGDDVVKREAVRMVFHQLPPAQWELPGTAVLLRTAESILKNRVG